MREPGGASVCGCAGRAGEDVRRERAAQAAVAEDFDPLRIRPYVSLPAPPPPGTATLPTAAAGCLPSAPRGAGDGAGSAEAGAGAASGDAEAGGPRAGRGRAYVLVGGACAVAAVTAAAVFATGLFSSAADRPTRNHALPDAPAPALAHPTGSTPPTARRPASPPRTHAPSAAPPTAPKPSASPTRSGPPRQSSPPAPPPSAPPSTLRVTGSVDATGSGGPATGTPLREGDTGPGVRELQARLAQLRLYAGEPDGAYTRAVTAAVLRYQWSRGLAADRPGEYGPRTRRSLEAETREP
ncbi:peptidoglycan-binding domain-containing protein [Streptomyces sp. NPDC005898]|uniref:peptidoglycan-binding domain-containing protein n=1 Tax=Streptomyces sp. NPDC005898 TaxID=3157082 RepID=UPI0033F75944